ncbi:MAG: cyclopropane fatty acyl phospholipid synthase [Desulfobacterales bacterium]
MRDDQRLVKELLAEAGVTVGGDRPWDLEVHDPRFYRRVIAERNLGLGESYMDGWWDCPRLDAFFDRLLRSGIEGRVRGSLRLALRSLPAILFNLQSRARARRVVDQHYERGNDLFLSFLDSYNQYSCAFFGEGDDLEEAQRRKMELICRKIDLQASDRLLDIGCGWGGFARYAAERSGCRVTAVNLSREQLTHAREFCRGLPVEGVETDYRDIEGVFDKIVSVGMFEHVGSKNYRCFMEKAASLLAADGVFLLQTIGGNDSRRGCDPWITRYIFPNGMLPSLAQIARAAEGLFVIEDVHNLGPHYDRTLLAWHRRFEQAWPRLAPKYGARFKRMWDYYLLSCAGAFRARAIQLWQIVFTRAGRGAPQPPCRPIPGRGRQIGEG